MECKKNGRLTNLAGLRIAQTENSTTLKNTRRCQYQWWWNVIQEGRFERYIMTFKAYQMPKDCTAVCNATRILRLWKDNHFILHLMFQSNLPGMCTCIYSGGPKFIYTCTGRVYYGSIGILISSAAVSWLILPLFLAESPEFSQSCWFSCADLSFQGSPTFSAGVRSGLWEGRSKSLRKDFTTVENYHTDRPFIIRLEDRQAKW